MPSVGCFTLVCLIIGSGINRVISDNPELHELCSQEVGTMLNGSSLAPDGLTPCEHVKMQLAITIAFMSGLIMVRVCVRVCVHACVCVCVC